MTLQAWMNQVNGGYRFEGTGSLIEADETEFIVDSSVILGV